MGADTSPCAKQPAPGNLVQDTADSPVLVTSDGGGLRWEMGGRLKTEGKCVYLWLIQVDGRNQHNIVKQLSSSKKKLKKKRITVEIWPKDKKKTERLKKKNWRYGS